ncbi:MAG: hypothetical protein L6R38_004164 [Xanthoria sp. 2 TBL-2021]|nr:MAG: hypothetical protein L6R38_004164 [Xanthoria sp. 2 TBL-2021]
MSDLDATTPRVFLVRHGETEWTKNGRYTGITDLELTPAGVNQVMATGTQLVGPGKLIDSAMIARVWVSPRKRAQQTCQLIFSGTDDIADKVTLTEDIAEWDHGVYEGLVMGEIRARRKEKGLDGERCTWSDSALFRQAVAGVPFARSDTDDAFAWGNWNP